MNKPLLSLLLIVLGFCTAFTQEITSDLSFYADVMVNASKAENRKRAGTEFYTLFTEYLSRPESKSNFFSEMPWITVVTPADSTFRVITWQVEEGEETYSYYGFVQFLKTDRSNIALKDTRTLKSESGIHDQDTWYGAIYYGIEPFRTALGEDAYVLLGFNAHNTLENIRVADILAVQDNGITFGMPVFTSDSTETKNRIIVSYSDVGTATMRFDREMDMIIYDHIIPINSPSGPLFVADGSYHGYKYAKGEWHFIDSVFNVIMEEPPGGRPPEPTKRDLFGREVKKD